MVCIMKYPCILILWLSLLTAPISLAAEWYISPDGKPVNPGTKEAPWDIASALDGSRKIAPGDTIYLFGGTYRRRPQELFEIRLAGTAGSPIQIRPIPGRRVRIDGGLSMQNPSAYVWVRDLEIFVSEHLPEKPVSQGSAPEDLKRPRADLICMAARTAST
jgi:hypothetical protein